MTEQRDGWHTRLMRTLVVWTFVVHTPWVVAIALALRPCLDIAAWAASALVWAGAVAALRPAVDATLPDWPRPAWRVNFLERPFLAHWTAVHASWPGWILGFVARGLGYGPPWGWALGTYVAALAVVTWGAFVTTARMRVRYVDLPICNLPPAFDGYRIVHLSDLHVGSFTPPERIARWLSRTRELPADLIAITGDMVSSGVKFHDAIVKNVGTLSSPDGVLVVPGNHDYFGGGQPLFRGLEQQGIRVLRNEHVSINRAGQQLIVGGVDDAWTQRADLDATLRGRPEGTVVLLSHDPALFDEARRAGVAVMLSGHTHGGQLAVPGLARWINLTRLSNPYSLGVYRRGSSTLVVSGGLGCTGLPLRVGVPPEVLVVRLRCAVRPISCGPGS